MTKPRTRASFTGTVIGTGLQRKLFQITTRESEKKKKKFVSNHMSVEKNIVQHLSAPTGVCLAKLVSV